MWKCSECDSYNDDGSFECYVCGTARTGFREIRAESSVAGDSAPERGSAPARDSGPARGSKERGRSDARGMLGMFGRFIMPDAPEVRRGRERRVAKVLDSALDHLKIIIALCACGAVFFLAILLGILIYQGRIGDVLNNAEVTWKAVSANVRDIALADGLKAIRAAFGNAALRFWRNAVELWLRARAASALFPDFEHAIHVAILEDSHFLIGGGNA